VTSDSRESARERYIAEYPSFEAAAKRAKKLLKRIVRDGGVTNAYVKVRAKSVSSFVKKLRKYPDDCWLKTTDKVGAQVVVQTLNDVATLRQLLEGGAGGLVHLYTKDSAEFLTDPRQLRYAGVHIQVTLPALQDASGAPIECEVQLRTQAQDVWASIEHHLVYKPVIEPPPHIARKIERLSVLVEMFDEEVDEAMVQISEDPRYEDAVLLQAAESLFHYFVTEPGEAELSLEVLSLLGSVFTSEERMNYKSRLTEFVMDHAETITKIFRDFGSGSEFAGQFAYFLFSQPESLIVYERLATKPMALASAVAGSEIEEAVRHVADAVGKPLSE
jgi:putative GTP pyrophosphokinase